MNKAMPFIVLGGVVFAYLIFKKTQSVSPSSPVSSPSNYKPAQPSQVYPFLPTTAPRVDNINQPWYVGPRVPMMGPVDNQSGIQGLARDVGAGASIVNSLSDVWGNLSDVFGGNGSEYDLNADYYEEDYEYA